MKFEIRNPKSEIALADPTKFINQRLGTWNLGLGTLYGFTTLIPYARTPLVGAAPLVAAL